MSCRKINLNKSVILLFILFVLVPNAFSFSSNDVLVNPIKDTFTVDSNDKSVQYNITILKPGDYILDFSSFGFDWFVSTIPQNLMFSEFNVDHNLTFTLKATLVKQLQPKIYAYVLSIKNIKTNEQINVPIKAIILPSATSNKTYPLVVRIITGISKTEVLPDDQVKLDVLIENKNPRNVGKVILTIKSKIFNLTKNYYLKPRTRNAKITDYKKYEVFTIHIPNKILPQDIPIEVKINYANQTYVKHYSLDVEPFRNSYSTILPSYIKWFNFPVVKILNISLVNKGNVEKNFFQKIKLGFFDKFVTTDLNQTNSTIILNETIPPYSERHHYVVIDYRPLVISTLVLILAILGLILLYYFTRAPIIFHKSLERYYFKAGYLYLVLNLTIKNRSRKTLKNVVIKEYLPAASEPVIDDLYLSPKTAKTKKGILLKWELNELEPKDERLLVYKVKFKLRIFGGVKFSPSELYYVKGNKTYKLISNELFVKL